MVNGLYYQQFYSPCVWNNVHGLFIVSRETIFEDKF